MPPKAQETPIERIYREVTGRKMPQSIKRILLRKPRQDQAQHKNSTGETIALPIS